jgi:hypothetical protein
VLSTLIFKSEKPPGSGGGEFPCYVAALAASISDRPARDDEFFGGNDADESDRRMDHRFRETLTFQQLLDELSDLGKSRY